MPPRESNDRKLIRLDIAKADIVSTFDKSTAKIFTLSDIQSLLAENRKNWRVSRSTRVEDFIKYLLKKTPLKRAKFPFPSRSEVRYIWREVPIYSVILSLRANSYFSHYTAMYLHQLTEQIPKSIYLNSEQTPKPKQKGPLAQERIDMAFKNRQRTTSNIAPYGEYNIHLLSGMYTGQLGVIDHVLPEGDTVRVTDIERTLIDIAVRPLYAGGVYEVLKAYRMAKGHISLNRLTATLKRLEYVYPYHQVIGFYLDCAGVYSISDLEPLRKMGLNYRFYLTHQIKDPAFSTAWQLYYPKGL